MRIFTKMRELLSTHKEILQKLEQLERKDMEHDEKIMLIFEEGKQIGMQNTRQVFEFVFKGKARKIAVQVGDNGYIVGANPVSRKFK